MNSFKQYSSTFSSVNGKTTNNTEEELFYNNKNNIGEGKYIRKENKV